MVKPRYSPGDDAGNPIIEVKAPPCGEGRPSAEFFNTENSNGVIALLRRAPRHALATLPSGLIVKPCARLGLTPMAVRQHMYQLQSQKLVAAEERPVPLGRPAKYWQLTREADRLFPDGYAEISVALIEAVGDSFGEAGLKRVLESRLAKQRADYLIRVPRSLPLREEVQRLARIRAEEGYMAEVKTRPSFW